MIDTTTTGLLTIRAWCEEGSETPLRAQIRVTKDVSSGFQSTLTVAHQEKVVDAVRGFLQAVLRSSAKES